MTDKSQSREKFDATHLPSMSSPDDWSDDTRNIYEAAFKLYDEGWQAAIKDQPAAAGAAGEELAQLRALANNAPNVEALPADAFYLSYQKWCREYLLPCLTRTAAPSPAVGGEEK